MTPVLVDTSVWRRYFAGRTTQTETDLVAELLDEPGRLLTHDAVVGELVLGGLAPREEAHFTPLLRAPEVGSVEVLRFVRARKLTRRGIGWTDVHLLASAMVANARLWTFDARLAEAAVELRIAFAR